MTNNTEFYLTWTGKESKMSKKHLHNQAAIPLAPAVFKKPQMRPMIVEYDPKKKGVKNDLSDVVMVK